MHALAPFGSLSLRAEWVGAAQRLARRAVKQSPTTARAMP